MGPSRCERFVHKLLTMRPRVFQISVRFQASGMRGSLRAAGQRDGQTATADRSSERDYSDYSNRRREAARYLMNLSASIRPVWVARYTSRRKVDSPASS